MSRLPLLAILAVAVASAQPAAPSWLDAPPRNWNKPGATIPQAPKMEFPPECAKMMRAARTSEEKAVERAGWKIPSFDTPDHGRRIIIVMGMASGDGMCRPEAYQVFIFVNRVFAGTISPDEMSARTDPDSMGTARAGDHGLVAEFKRYTEDDPLCCPSRVSRATYEIQQQSGKPVVVLTNVTTEHVP
jgi:LppP/LprE lipoprotein